MLIACHIAKLEAQWSGILLLPTGGSLLTGAAVTMTLDCPNTTSPFLLQDQLTAIGLIHIAYETMRLSSTSVIDLGISSRRSDMEEANTQMPKQQPCSISGTSRDG